MNKCYFQIFFIGIRMVLQSFSQDWDRPGILVFLWEGERGMGQEWKLTPVSPSYCSFIADFKLWNTVLSTRLLFKVMSLYFKHE